MEMCSFTVSLSSPKQPPRRTLASAFTHAWTQTLARIKVVSLLSKSHVGTPSGCITPECLWETMTSLTWCECQTDIWKSVPLQAAPPEGKHQLLFCDQSIQTSSTGWLRSSVVALFASFSIWIVLKNSEHLKEEVQFNPNTVHFSKNTIFLVLELH